eukprot:1159605-Pelagomonas_calceolata.AAC.3
MLRVYTLQQGSSCGAACQPEADHPFDFAYPEHTIIHTLNVHPTPFYLHLPARSCPGGNNTPKYVTERLCSHAAPPHLILSATCGQQECQS